MVDAAEPRAARYIIFDTAVPGFGLRVTPNGAKSWIFEYRPGEGGRRVSKKRLTLGSGTDFTPDQARKTAEQYRSIGKTGGDPQGEKTNKRETIACNELAKEFLEHIEEKRSASTHSGYQSTLNNHFFANVWTTQSGLNRSHGTR
ncbi:DUF4102 domain-containing protein [Devosia sp. MC532]|uniref:integrase arm-type DNA-binding domain-containing protein n=1 Tax=Devosia sp. MC532 TaxID=2799788 RepID=UPI0018F6031C|nr:DUF4102 domain-containing protein [Devosia sp. MC532]